MSDIIGWVVAITDNGCLLRVNLDLLCTHDYTVRFEPRVISYF